MGGALSQGCRDLSGTWEVGWLEGGSQSAELTWMRGGPPCLDSPVAYLWVFSKATWDDLEEASYMMVNFCIRALHLHF